MTKRVLNIGCGDSTEGTDFADLYPQRKEVHAYNADMDELPFSDNTFDEVTNEYLFEHLKDRRLFLSEVYRVLKPGGSFYMQTDNAGFLLYHNKKSKVMTHMGGYKFHGEDDKHYSLFTTAHIQLFLEDHRFEDISVTRFNRDGFSKPIEILLWLIRKTRFEWITYAQLMAVGTKPL